MSSLPPPVSAPSGVARSRLARLWSQFWRISLAVTIGFVAFSVIYVDAMDAVDIDGPEAPALTAVMLADLALGTAAIILYGFRRFAPLPITIAIALMSSFSIFSVGAVMLAVASLSTRRRWKEIVVIAVILVGVNILGAYLHPFIEPVSLWETVWPAILGTGIFVLIGLYIGGRRQLLESLIAQAASAQREQQAKIEQAHAHERARIAHEMHDVLAHRLSLVALHAGALEYRTDLSSEQVRTTAGVVRSSVQLALTELRDVLGVLHEPSTDGSREPLLPQQGLGALERLVEESRASGSDTSVTVDQAIAQSLDSLSEVHSRHLFRIVQEGLTNARKHAPGAPVEVRISGEPDVRVFVTVSNPKLELTPARSVAPQPESPKQSLRTSHPVIEPPRSGFGLAGLRERVRLAGGELSVSDAPDAFTLQVWVPWNS